MSASASSAIIWNPGNITGTNVLVSPLVNTAYIAQSTNACGVSKDTVNIAVIPKPYVMASVDDSFCIGSGIQISATSFLPITWNPGGLNGNNVTVNPSANTQYIAQVSNACGIAKDTVNIKVVQQPIINAIADTIACPNNSIQMTASSNANILWTPGNIAGQVYNVVATANSTYIATASNLCGAKKDTVNITVLPIPTLTARADTSICAGQNVQIFANSNINAAIWNPGNINAISFNANPSITTQYISTSSNKCGIAKDTVVITVNPLSEVDL
ncbi:MAG: hypothetical protein IPK03_00205 [Bacteroidetes bacterium]|nr:hypothetical protein [Bacteroidota bacterium]